MKLKLALPIVVIFSIAIIVALRLITIKKLESFLDLNKIEADLDVPINDMFTKSNELQINNEKGIMNKKIRDKILNMVLNKKVNDPKSEINEMNNENNTETKDFIRKIFDTDNQIFTESINHEILCNNLKYELIKLTESNKPVSVIMRDFNITSKKKV